MENWKWQNYVALGILGACSLLVCKIGVDYLLIMLEAIKNAPV